ncbi:MAG: lipid-A-disaccharide synthase [Candidatus Eisenbacteria bacterium]
MKRAFLLAGESSGDLQGALLARELKTRRPDLELWGVGGERMAAEGVRLVLNADALAVVGFAEVVSILPRILQALRTVGRSLAKLRPDVFVPIDYPDFNFRLLAPARRLGIPIAYYISPQVWAWRSGRVHTLRRHVDRVIVIFPFEEAIYRDHDVPVTWVGHPLVDRLPEEPERWRAELRARLVPGSETAIALLPGSRRGEVARIAPLLRAVRQRIEAAAERPLRWIVGQASGLPTALLQGIARDAAIAPGFEALAAADLALVASGTATLESLLVGTPSIVVYRTSPVTYQIARRLVKVPHIAMANLVAGQRLLPEFVQDAADPEAIASVARSWIGDAQERERIRLELLAARASLGPPGAAGRAADVVLEVMEKRD